MKRTTASKLILSSAFALALAATSSARAETIGLWTFETGQPSALPAGWTSSAGLVGTSPGNFASDIGTGSATALTASGAALWDAPAGNGSPRALAGNHWAQGDYYQFSVTVPAGYAGWGDVTVSFDQNGSATGPGHWNLQYSTDGSTFTTFGSDYALTANITWNSTTLGQPTHEAFDLGTGGGLNNPGTIYFRVVEDSAVTGGAINGGNVGTSGTDRIDNFIVTIPEPTSVTLLSGFAGLLIWISIRRRR